jgi:metallo-beta-lactamase class B
VCTRCVFLTGLTALMTAPAVGSTRAGDPQALEIAMPGMRRLSDTRWLGRLTPNVYVHTTTHILEGVGYYPANGAIIVDGTESLLIDTGWNDADTDAILAAWERLPTPPISRALVTHFHYDRLGGIGALSRRGIPAFGNPLTIGLALDSGFAAPRPLHHVERQRQRIGSIEVFYPGAGHTIDNVVAWIPSDGVLCRLRHVDTPARIGGDEFPLTISEPTSAIFPGELEVTHQTLYRHSGA